jgi:hypothetical protein
MMGKPLYLPRNGFSVKNIGMNLMGWRHKMNDSRNSQISPKPPAKKRILPMGVPADRLAERDFIGLIGNTPVGF